VYKNIYDVPIDNKMTTLTFQMLLHSQYSDDKNTIDHLHIEHLIDDEWQEFELDLLSPGFDIFMYAILTCQHMYMRVNCAERGLQLGSSEGSITVGADDDWNLETLEIDFTVTLSSGHVDQEHTDYIISRMRQCPVSRNIRDIPDVQTRITFGESG